MFEDLPRFSRSSEKPFVSTSVRAPRLARALLRYSTTGGSHAASATTPRAAGRESLARRAVRYAGEKERENARWHLRAGPSEGRDVCFEGEVSNV
jgi:hypothetical protein